MFRKNNVFILEYTKVIDPTREQFSIKVSLPDNATKEKIKETFDKMSYVGDKRIELINKVEMESQKAEVEKHLGDTPKNQANVDKLKGSVKKSN
jgi:hypothetical protein